VPENSNLYIHNRPEPIVINEDGKAKSKPFFWTAAGGINYKLEKNGEIIKKGKLQAAFRPVSIFWPPVALIYWPIGFDSNITYDLASCIFWPIMNTHSGTS
jgi:hypothetical protein